MLTSAMGYLSGTDATAMAAETQARCLQELERVTAMGTAARASILAAFTSGQGYCADADYSPRAWLIHKTRVTKGAAVGHTAWARRAGTHPQVLAALAAGDLSESYARTICQWTDRLPKDCQAAADEILMTAARAGMNLPDLSALFAQIYERSRPDLPDEDPDRALEDRAVRLETTFAGAGVLSGDLTPQCAAVVTAVLDALSAPAGAADTRTHEQRYHDALQEAMRRLLAADLLPERAGQPVRALVHVSLADLMLLDGSSALLEEWTAGVRAQWAAHRAAASVGGSDGGAWLDGAAARAFVCDASVTPVVTGEVNPAALEDLVRLCVQLDKLSHDDAAAPATAAPATTAPATTAARPRPARTRRGRGRRSSRPSSARPPACCPGRAAWPGSCAAGSSAPGSPAPACPWTSGVILRHPGRDPPRGHPAGPALPVPGRLRPARRGLRGAPPDPQGRRRQDQRAGLRPVLHLPPPGRDPPVGLDRGPES